MPKKKARRALGARRADGRSIASKMMVSTDTLRVQARLEPSPRTVWLGLRKKSGTKTEMKSNYNKKAGGGRIYRHVNAARVCARWCSACKPAALPKLTYLGGIL